MILLVMCKFQISQKAPEDSASQAERTPLSFIKACAQIAAID